MKKFFIAIVVLAILGLIGYGIWRFFLSPKNGAGGPEAAPAPGTAPAPSSPSANAPGPIVGYWIKQNDVFAVAPDGKLLKFPLDLKQSEVFLSLNLSVVGSVLASPSGRRAVLVSPRPSDTTFSYFDLETKSIESFSGESVTSAAWESGGDERLAYLAGAGGASSLKILTPEGGAVKGVINISQAGLALDWRLPKEIYLLEKPSAETPGSLRALNIEKKIIRTLISDEAGLMVAWSDDGTQGIKFNSDDGPSKLTLINQDGLVIGKIQAATLPSKCAIKGTLFVCAVPKNFPENAVLPDDYFKRKFYTEDEFHVWDSAAGGAAKVIKTGFPTDAEKLTIAGGRVYFLNRYDRKLYTVELPK